MTEAQLDKGRHAAADGQVRDANYAHNNDDNEEDTLSPERDYKLQGR